VEFHGFPYLLQIQEPFEEKVLRQVLLFVVNDPSYFLSHRLPIALAAKESGYDVHIASIESDLGVLIGELGFNYHVIPLRRGSVNPLTELYSLYCMWRLIYRLRPTVLHLVTMKPVLYGGLASRIAPVGSVVAAVAGLGSVFISERNFLAFLRLIIKPLYRMALSHKNLKVIFQNRSDREYFISLGLVKSNKAVLIRGSGVDLKKYLAEAEPESPVVVTFAGRLIEDKGVREFISAARQLSEEGVHAVFQLVGELDEGNPTSLTCADLRLLREDSGFRILGFRRDMHRVLSASHIVVLPSYREGLPKILMEAAACGRAVITTDVPGCRDAIEEKITGLLVPPRNSCALKQAIHVLIENNKLRQRFGFAGRKLAENNFDVNFVVDQHLKIYNELILVNSCALKL
jgi:glycosyltransferase involved in cell wall biosynthesis